jgi:hypothetical protein
MKKIYCLKLISKICCAAAFAFITAAAFISCENFMKGEESARELERLISLANAPSSTVLFKSDSSMGTFLSGSSKELKIGYETEILFSANLENGLLDTFVAQSITDSSKDMAQYITIKMLDRDDEKALYKFSVTLLKQAPDIVVKPVFISYPVIQSYSPKTDSSPVYANTPITVTFNIPMEAETVLPSQSLFNYSNIFITCNNQSIEEYLETPVFNSSKTILTLKPKDEFLGYLISLKETFVSINVSFGSNIAARTGTIELPLRQDENVAFTVKFKPEVEKNPPVKADFFASSQDYSLADLSELLSSQSASQLKRFNQDDISVKGNYTVEEYSAKVVQNVTSEQVYIYGYYYDDDSGVKSVSVTWQYTNNKDGVVLKSEPHTPDTFYTDVKNDQAEFLAIGKYVLFKIKYQISDDDGAYLFNVSVCDSCYNRSQEESFTAIKDAELNIASLKPFNLYHDIETNNSSADQRYNKLEDYLNNPDFNEILKTLKFVYGKPVYSSVEDPDLVDIFVKYINKEQEEVTEPVYHDEQNKRLYVHKLDVEYVHDLKITIIVKDKFDHVETRDFYFPPQPQKYSDSNAIYFAPGTKATEAFSMYYNENEGTYSLGVQIEEINRCGDFLFANPDDGKTFFIYENDMLYSELSADYVFGPQVEHGSTNWFEESQELKLPPDIYLDNMEITPGISDDQHHYSLTVTLPDDIWYGLEDTYDYIALYSYPEDPSVVGVYEKGCLTTKINYEKVNPGTKSFFIAGIKDGKRSNYSYSSDNPDGKQDYDWYDSTTSDIDKKIYKESPPFLDSFRKAAWFLPGLKEQYGTTKFLPPCAKVDEYLAVPDTSGKIDALELVIDHAYRYTYSGKTIGKSKEYFIYEIDGGDLYIPIIEWHYGMNSIAVTLENEHGTTSYGQNFTISESPLVYHVPQNLPAAETSLEFDPTEFDVPQEAGSTAYICYLDADGWHDDFMEHIYDENTKPSTVWQKTVVDGKYKWSLKTPYQLQQNVFIKVITVLDWGEYISSELFYNGKPSGGELTDKFIDMGDYYLVSSNKPVYLYTVATMQPYKECSKWSVHDWDTLHYKANEQCFDFTSNDSSNLRFYAPDTSWMREGYNYVTVAHFADGHSVISKVRQK